MPGSEWATKPNPTFLQSFEYRIHSILMVSRLHGRFTMQRVIGTLLLACVGCGASGDNVGSDFAKTPIPLTEVPEALRKMGEMEFNGADIQEAFKKCRKDGNFVAFQ